MAHIRYPPIGVLVPIGTRHPLKNTRQDQMSDITQFRAKNGEAITIQNGKLHVPNNPVVPYVEGDGTGPDIWRASVRIFDAAIAKAEALGFDLQGGIMASDAFFPFADCIELAADAGIALVIQPGGSIKDQESIDIANQKGMGMVTTGIRHFKH